MIKKQAYNPYLPTYEYIPDGEPRVFGDRVYVYGSHDRAQGTDYCQNDYICYSAPIDDLGNWRYEGIIFQRVQEPMYNGENISRLYAPDVVQGVDGKYYLYYSMENSEVISVAVCEEPAGKYEFLGHVHDESGYEWGSKDGDWIEFDPGVLVDDDGKVYLYSGFNPFFPFKENKTYVGAHVFELKSDMVTTVGQPKIVMPKYDESLGSHNFFEASSIRKIDDTYYFVYSSQQCVELCYATSKYPDRDFVYGGTIVSNIDVGFEGNTEPKNHGGNNHGGMVKINDQWYIFYHRPTNMTMFSRQGSAEPITILPDGSIKQVEMTSCGLNGGPLRGDGLYSAGIACNLMNAKQRGFTARENMENPDGIKCIPYLTQDGEDREEEPGTYVTNIVDGAIVGFKYFDLTNTRSIKLTVKGSMSGKVYAVTEGEKIVASLEIENTKDWKNYETECHVDGEMKKAGIYFRFEIEGAGDFKEFELCK